MGEYFQATPFFSLLIHFVVIINYLILMPLNYGDFIHLLNKST